MKQASVVEFVDHLEKLGGVDPPKSNPDRRVLAALRRSFATWPKVPPEAVRVIAPFLPERAAGWWETVYYLIAGLFALYPCASSHTDGRAPSLGAALRQANSGESGGPERRLLALLRCTAEDLPNHLRHTATYLQSQGVPIDYCQLMRDLFWWDSGDGKVQRRWGRDFWSSSSDDRPKETKESVAKENNYVH